MDNGRSCANCSSTDRHISACSTYKQGMKSIDFSLKDEDASEIDHKVFMRGAFAKCGPRCFFCNLEGHFRSDCPHQAPKEVLSGVKASRSCLMS